MPSGSTASISRQGVLPQLAVVRAVRSFHPLHDFACRLYTYPQAEDGSPTYTHMAMIAQLPNGTLLAAWQAGDGREATPGQHLVTCASLDGVLPAKPIVRCSLRC